MPYQPNYCNHCGEKVERVDWKIWTSSRFCENCEGEFRKVDWLPRVGLILAGIGGLFGFGSYLKTPEKTLALSNNQLTVNSSNKPQPVKTEQVGVNSNIQNSMAKPIIQANIGLQNQTKAGLLQKSANQQIPAESQQNVENEPVYFCGAQTKKGTPCTRKVKGGGRCWQHQGLPAMSAKEKLVASQ